MPCRHLIIPRPRVTGELLQAVLNHGLVVVSAPVGYGKTVAAEELRQSFIEEGRQVGEDRYAQYMTANPGEDSPEYLAQRHLNILTSDHRIPLSRVLDPYPSPFSLSQRAAALDQLRLITSHTRHLLIIDDSHHLRDSRYHDFFLRLLTVPNFCFLLLSRRRPDLPLEELSVKGRCRAYGRDLLRFSDREADDFFRRQGITEPAAIHSLRQKASGWAAGLRLEAEAWLNGNKPAGEDDYHRLLYSSFFRQYSPEERRMILKLSIWPEFTESQAEAVCPNSGAGLLLFQLRADNAFIEYDCDRRTYRFDDIFRSFCRACFWSEPPDSIDHLSLLQRAGQWCLENNRPAQALELKAEAEEARPGPDRGGRSLTARERQILSLVAEGRNNRQIADQLGIQRVTVAKALSNIYQKLEVKNRAQAVNALWSAR